MKSEVSRTGPGEPVSSGLGIRAAALGISGGLCSALLSHGQAQAWEGSGAGPPWVLSRR